MSAKSISDTVNQHLLPYWLVYVLIYGLSIITIILAILAWGSFLQWHIAGVSNYGLFPIFGLIAFSLLWSQYITLALRDLLHIDNKLLKPYFMITGYLILVAILLHPGILIWQLWRDGHGLPMRSYFNYVNHSLRWFTILGTINLTILLFFEARRWLAKKRWWRYVTYVVDLVVISVYIHALKLGTQVNYVSWYHKVWYVYGILLILALSFIYYQRLLTSHRPTSR